MSDRKLNEVAKHLIKAKKSIENPKDWCQNNLRVGHRICAQEALISAYRPSAREYWKASLLLCESANEMLPPREQEPSILSVVRVNDKKGHEAVMKMYDKAIQKAINNGAGNDVSPETE